MSEPKAYLFGVVEEKKVLIQHEGSSPESPISKRLIVVYAQSVEDAMKTVFDSVADNGLLAIEYQTEVDVLDAKELAKKSEKDG